MTTNIYLLVDTSLYAKRYVNRLQQNITKTARALSFTKEKTNLHLICYNDRANIQKPYERIRLDGNPNLGEGLSYLLSVMRYVQKYNGKKTRSIFILHTSGNVLYGWERPLKELFRTKEFAFGLRYIVTYAKPDRQSAQAYRMFTDSQDKILPHFSEKRLCSLVQHVATVG